MVKNGRGHLDHGFLKSAVSQTVSFFFDTSASKSNINLARDFFLIFFMKSQSKKNDEAQFWKKKSGQVRRDQKVFQNANAMKALMVF